jgi:hypothetical protein
MPAVVDNFVSSGGVQQGIQFGKIIAQADFRHFMP